MSEEFGVARRMDILLSSLDERGRQREGVLATWAGSATHDVGCEWVALMLNDKRQNSWDLRRYERRKMEISSNVRQVSGRSCLYQVRGGEKGRRIRMR